MSKQRIDRICNEIKEYVTGHGCKNVTIGLSGGKDSTVAAALCAQALGPAHVIGVWMPAGPFVGDHGVEVDEDVRRVCEDIGIVNFLTVGIGGAMVNLQSQVERHVPISTQARINIQPRLRMTALYCVSQSYGESMVINTTNLDETIACYGTVWGDMCGDLAVLRWLHVREIVDIGDELGLPHDLVHKEPDDGLSGVPDEVNLGFHYSDAEHLFENYASNYKLARETVFGQMVAQLDSRYARDLVPKKKLLPDKTVQRMILDRMMKNLFKLKEINVHGCGGYVVTGRGRG